MSTKNTPAADAKRRPRRRAKADPGLEAAILSVGGVVIMSELIGTSHANISQWGRCPAERVPQVSKVSGIPRHVLRPDLYEAPAREREQA